MHSTVAVDVAAPASLVFQLARDVERWPALLPHYLDVRVLERHQDGALTARMVALRPLVRWVGYGLPVAWRARTWSIESELQLRFVHLGGATDGMDVTWRIEPTQVGCHITIEHGFDAAPGWAAIIDRLFVRPIATRTLATFKSIAETVAQVEAASPTTPRRSGRSRSAKKNI